MKKIIVIVKTTMFIDIYDECYPKNFGATYAGDSEDYLVSSISMRALLNSPL